VTAQPRRRLSSRTTQFHKLVFPLGWIGVFAVVTALTFVAPVDASKDPRPVRWFFAAVTVVGGWLILSLALPLKHVETGDSSFFVSERTREIEVPFSEVVKVTRSRFVNPPRVTLHLRRSGAFGDRIVFLPPIRLFPGRKAHPIVKELQQLIGLPA
jgi:hypothetical protein